MRATIRGFVLLMISLNFVPCDWLSPAVADEGQSVAVRYWPGQAVTIETMWNFHVGIRNTDVKEGLPRIPDLVMQMNQVPSLDGKMNVRTHGWNGSPRNEYVLDRKPNEEQIAWTVAKENASLSSNAVHVSRIPVELTTAQGQPTFVSLIVVDGVRIVDTGGANAEAFLAAMKANSDAGKSIQSVDAILFTATSDSDSLQSISETFHPRLIVIPAGGKLDSVGTKKIRVLSHNTLALAAKSTEFVATDFVALAQTPFELSEELRELFAKKETACQESRQVFTPLTIEQMNFAPSNGTHTPRWNAEHMMGRELGFFSQIYHAVDPIIPVMDLNPQQMPKDYRARHADWTGAEEGRQMLRVEAFTRRFAFLLDGLEMDKRAPGSRMWTPRALLKQMERHYSEHTANVVKKQSLPDWPRDQ